ncbi:MAG: dockerin type I repeat-containing protein, partial [Eubacteriales bacterium]|nr:dockerin type I repeat-containing protein [Eubacteriales bacterium]
KTISNIAVGSSVEDVKNGFTCEGGVTIEITTSDNSEASGKIATGNVVKMYNSSNSVIAEYTVVIYGDPTGDGEIDIFDVARIKMHKLGRRTLEGVFMEAADCNHDGEIDIFDVAAIKMDVLKRRIISQIRS